MFRSRICDLVGIKYPIFQGGMAWVSESILAASVSNAGGLGIISAGNADANYVREQIRKCKKLTDKPFGVNVMLLSPFAAEVAEVLAQEKVAVVTTGAGNPGKYMQMWLDAGIKVIPVVPSVALAQKVESIGACAVIAEGGESGGHIGDLATITLVPQVCDAVKVPVIAAGGIADGRGMAAAFILGAEGVQCGTRFLSAVECQISDVYKQKVLSANDTDTIVTGRRSGHPVRALKTPFTRKFAKMEQTGATDEELNVFGTGALRKAVKEGNESEGCYMAGQSAGMVKKIQTSEDIIKDIISECQNILQTASNKYLQ
jgi:enoyl-[acyl-carrier protein] reductase II